MYILSSFERQGGYGLAYYEIELVTLKRQKITTKKECDLTLKIRRSIAGQLTLIRSLQVYYGAFN